MYASELKYYYARQYRTGALEISYAAEFDYSRGKVFIGIAYFNPNDKNPSKAFGRELARDRALYRRLPDNGYETILTENDSAVYSDDEGRVYSAEIDWRDIKWYLMHCEEKYQGWFTRELVDDLFNFVHFCATYERIVRPALMQSIHTHIDNAINRGL